MQFNFDEIVDRRNSQSAKWKLYPDDVLPMWVADMDFRSPPAVMDALHRRIDHGVFGYEFDHKDLAETICERMARLYNWQIVPEAIFFIPSLVTGLNAVSRAVGEPGDGTLILTPVYPPFLSAPTNHGRVVQAAQLALVDEGRTFRYELDDDAIAAAITPRTRLFIHCHPHNPTGHEYTHAEQLRLAEICERHNLIICSDEIHCDLMMGKTEHMPLAALAPDIAQRTITLMAPSKTFNVPGLSCSFAIIPNEDLRKQVMSMSAGIVPHVNVLGFTAALAAYREGGEWLRELLAYLTVNRDIVTNFVVEHLPQIRTTVPEATYLSWFDCRAAGMGENPAQFLIDHAKVALNNGAMFGPGGDGFVRLNFGCPRPILMDGLQRIEQALKG